MDNHDPGPEPSWSAVVTAGTQLAEALLRYDQAKREFLTHTSVRGAILRRELKGRHWKTALDLCRNLSSAENFDLLPELIRLATVGHGLTDSVRSILLNLPRKTLLERLNEEVEPHLRTGGDEEYRRILELYEQVDTEAARRIALRASTNDDEEIAEVGRDFLSKLGEGSP